MLSKTVKCINFYS